MPELFTVEEINLMCIFDTSDKDALLADLTAAIPYLDEPELVEIADSVLAKLSQMSGAEFSALEFYPEYNDERQV